MVASLVDALQRLGANRVEALLIAHLVSHGTARTKQIMEATDLRQPEVSVGMRTLRERGWVETEPVPREGKGRPMHAYRLATDRSALASYYATRGEAEVASYREAIDSVRRELMA